MKQVIRMVCIMICGGLAACSTVPANNSPDAGVSGSQKAAPASTPVFPGLDAWLAENRMTINAGQSAVVEYDRAFAQGVVIAYGEGYPKTGVEGGQKRLTAQRAAEVSAQRNMAAYFARYATGGEIRFNSFHMRLDAFLRGAEVVASDYNPERQKGAVLLRLDLRGAAGFVK